MKKITLIAALLGATAFPLSCASAATTMVTFSLDNNSVSLANGSFSYDAAKTGQLSYADLQSFTFSLPTSTYDLAFVNSGSFSVFRYFGFNATTQTFVTRTNYDFPEILSAIKGNGVSGYFVRNDAIATVFHDYAAGFGPVTYTNVSINVTTSGVSAVPEPATWAMMLMGFGMVGYGLRTARKGKVINGTHA